MPRPSFWQSPTVLRTANALATSAQPISSTELAKRAFVSRHWANTVLRQMRREGCAYIADWRRHYGQQIDGFHGGGDTPLYAVGDKPDAARPPKMPNAVALRRYKDRLAEELGKKMAIRRLKSRKEGGADRIVVDGKTVYQRRPRREVLAA